MEGDSPIIGELVLYPPERCPRVVSSNGKGRYLPLWPPDYKARVENGAVYIVDGLGEVVASVGDRLQLDGGAISKNWESAEYRRLYYELTGDCFGPYGNFKD